MSLRDVDRYRGSCLVVSEPRGRGGPLHGRRGRLCEELYSAGGTMAPWQVQRIGRPVASVAPSIGFFYERSSPLVGAPIFSFIPYRHGTTTHLPSNPRPQNRALCSSLWHHNRWTAGSAREDFASSREKDEVECLSRLAIDGETGANGRTAPVPAPSAPTSKEEDREGSLSPPNSSSDAVSVTSDDGGANSLPRIIKPRKRRKKDRKPVAPPIAASTASSPEEDTPKTIITLKPYAPMCRTREGSSSPPCCSQCSSPLLFPTPPSSPSLASCSEDETGCSIWSRTTVTLGGDPKGVLVRSYSAPHHPPLASPFVSRVRISSSMTPSFRVDDTAPSGRSSCAPPRSRHYSTPSARSFPNNRQKKPLSESEIKLLRDCAVRTPTPVERGWVNLTDPNTSSPSCIYTVMCYNVLCDKYATRQMYGYCPPWALEWSYRKKGIMDEIRRYSADIITLQEIETDQFYAFFLPELKKDGYDGIFSPKSRAKHMSESERKYVDGCAIFWRINKFVLAKEHLIEFNQLAMANHDGSEDMLNRVMTKDNIGLAALLHTKEAAWGENLPAKSQICQPILVCTAHIHWDPEFCDVKLIQTIMLMSEIRGIVNQIIEETRSKGGPKLDIHDIHLLLCGDLNSLPESGVIEFLTKGSVSMDHTDLKGLGYKTPLQKIALSKSHNAGLVNTSANIYTHSFRLAATYGFSVMPYTNYTYDFKGIIDYIFHSCNGMRTLGVLGPIDPDWFTSNKVVGCPHPHIPSDHFPLLVELELTPPTQSHPNGLLHR